MLFSAGWGEAYTKGVNPHDYQNETVTWEKSTEKPNRGGTSVPDAAAGYTADNEAPSSPLPDGAIN